MVRFRAARLSVSRTQGVNFGTFEEGKQAIPLPYKRFLYVIIGESQDQSEERMTAAVLKSERQMVSLYLWFPHGAAIAELQLSLAESSI